MIEQVNGFITPMKGWDAVEKNDKKITGTENGTKSVFQSVLEDTVQNVYDTQKDVEQKQYLLATGQLEDAHSLPIAQAKAELSLEVMISLRNKAMETSVYKGYKRDKIEMRGDRAEISDFPRYLNTVAGGLDCRDQTIGGFSFVVKIYAVPVVEIIG